MIVAVASAKGGVGKTTTALHLAGLLSLTGPTLLADDDPNRSATRYAARAEARGQPLPFAVATGADQRRALQALHQHLVIDTPARADPVDVRALALAADHLVIPTAPDPMSLEAALDTAAVLGGLPKWALLLTMCPSRPERDAIEARHALERAGVPLHQAQIRKAKAFQVAAMRGQLVWDTRTPRRGLATADYRDLMTEITEGHT